MKVWTHPQGDGGAEVDEEEEGSFARLMHNIDEANSKHSRAAWRQRQRPRVLLAPPEGEIAVSRVESGRVGRTQKFGFPKSAKKVGTC